MVNLDYGCHTRPYMQLPHIFGFSEWALPFLHLGQSPGPNQRRETLRGNPQKDCGVPFSATGRLYEYERRFLKGLVLRNNCEVQRNSSVLYVLGGTVRTTVRSYRGARTSSWMKHASFRRMLGRRRSSNPGNDNVDVATTALLCACASHETR